MSTEDHRFYGFSPESYSIALDAGAEYFGKFGMHIERTAGAPAQNSPRVYTVHYGFDPLHGAALRAVHRLP